MILQISYKKQYNTPVTRVTLVAYIMAHMHFKFMGYILQRIRDRDSRQKRDEFELKKYIFIIIIHFILYPNIASRVNHNKVNFRCNILHSTDDVFFY